MRTYVLLSMHLAISECFRRWKWLLKLPIVRRAVLSGRPEDSSNVRLLTPIGWRNSFIQSVWALKELDSLMKSDRRGIRIWRLHSRLPKCRVPVKSANHIYDSTLTWLTNLRIENIQKIYGFWYPSFAIHLNGNEYLWKVKRRIWAGNEAIWKTKGSWEEWKGGAV